MISSVGLVLDLESGGRWESAQPTPTCLVKIASNENIIFISGGILLYSKWLIEKMESIVIPLHASKIRSQVHLETSSLQKMTVLVIFIIYSCFSGQEIWILKSFFFNIFDQLCKTTWLTFSSFIIYSKRKVCG